MTVDELLTQCDLVRASEKKLSECHWQCIGTPEFTTKWQHYEVEVTVPDECDGEDNGNYKNDFNSIAFNLSKDRTHDITFYFDNISIYTTKDVPVPEGIRGDANGDGNDSVTDIAVEVNCVLQLPNTGGFSEYGADANGDGSVTVTDIGVIVDKILGTNASSRKMEQVLEPQ